ncbi:MAG: putative glycoside hydrolase [Oscillospiraceae bacterium]|nr:putative glycoside hydrolase [Oscillospiraceae bacterium]
MGRKPVKLSSKKPIKVKRYKRSFSGSGDRRNWWRGVIGFGIFLIVLFGVGWLVAKPGLDIASTMWYNWKNGGDVSSSQVEPEVLPESQPQPQEPEEPVVEEPVRLTQGKWQSLTTQGMDSEENIRAVAKSCAQQGYTHALITFKDDSGKVYYNSAAAQSVAAVAENSVDAALIARVFTEEGVVPCAQISAFKDPIAPYSDRSAAIWYQNQEGFLWLDNAAEKGGKPWLNPYAASAQKYITDVATELAKSGYTEIVVDNLRFPGGYLASAGYGATNGITTADVLKNYAASLQQTLAQIGSTCWFNYSAQGLISGNEGAYGTTDLSIFNLPSVVMTISTTQNTAGETAFAEDEISAFSTVFQKLSQNNTKEIALRIEGTAADSASLQSVLNAASNAGITQIIYS